MEINVLFNVAVSVKQTILLSSNSCKLCDNYILRTNLLSEGEPFEYPNSTWDSDDSMYEEDYSLKSDGYELND